MTVPPRPLIRTAQVAAILDMTVERFYRVRPWLEDRYGFPPPVLPRRWDPVAIEAWIDARNARKTADDSDPAEHEEDDSEAAMAARAAALARNAWPGARGPEKPAPQPPARAAALTSKPARR